MQFSSYTLPSPGVSEITWFVFVVEASCSVNLPPNIVVQSLQLSCLQVFLPFPLPMSMGAIKELGCNTTAPLLLITFLHCTGVVEDRSPARSQPKPPALAVTGLGEKTSGYAGKSPTAAPTLIRTHRQVCIIQLPRIHIRFFNSSQELIHMYEISFEFRYVSYVRVVKKIVCINLWQFWFGS